MTPQVSKTLRAAFVLGAVAASTLAQGKRESLDPGGSTTQAIRARRIAIAERGSTLRANFGPRAQIAALRSEYAALSEWLGGDDPANAGRALGGPQPFDEVRDGPLAIVNPACGSGPTTTNVSGT